MELYISAWASLSLNKESNSLELIWKKECSSEEYRETISEGLRALKNLNVSNWLSDITKLGAVSPTDRLWMEFNFLPKALEYGVQTIALVVPEDIFTIKYAHRITETCKGLQMNIHHFSTRQAAREWLALYSIKQKPALK